MKEGIFLNPQSDIFNSIKIIGDGSCFSKGYKCTSFYFTLNHTCYLFECSFDTFQYIKEHMQEFSQYKRFIISISHFHEDHIGGLGSFIYLLKYSMNMKEVTVITPSESNMKKYLTLVAPSFNADFKTSIITKLIPNKTNSISIQTVSTNHDGNMPCCGLLVGQNTPYSKFFDFYYTGDSASFETPTIESHGKSFKIFDLFNHNEIYGLIAEVSLNPSPVHTCFSEYEQLIDKQNWSRVKFVHFNSTEEEQIINSRAHA